MKHLALTITIAALLCGCTMTQKRAAYTSLKVVAQTVDSSRQLYSEAKVLGKVKPEKIVEIEGAIRKYQISMNAAIAAVRFNWEAPAPTDVQALATLVTLLIQETTR